MTQEPASNGDRAQVLRDDAMKTFSLSTKLVDWRSALAWAAFAGGVAFAILSTEASRAWWVLAIWLGAAAIMFGFARRRMLKDQAVLLIEQAQADIARDAALDNTKWDRSRLGELPDYYLQPLDMTSPAQLEALMRVPPSVAKQQAAELPGSIFATALFGVLMLAGVVLAGVVPVVWLVSSFDSFLDGSFAGVPLALIAGVVSGAILLFGFSESTIYVAAARTASGLLVGIAAAELPRLWSLDPGYTQGQVVRWTPNGYTLDPTRMSLPPTPRARSKFLRSTVKASLIVFGAVVLVAIAVIVVVVVISRVAT